MIPSHAVARDLQGNSRVLSINVGSSSVKFGVYDMGLELTCLESKLDRPGSVADALHSIHRAMKQAGVERVDAVGHRVAHGGAEYAAPTLVDAAVEAAIERYTPWAPQHNPGNLAGILSARELWPGVPQVAVFDTSFHRTMPPRASTYAIPQVWRDAGLRRYGFHGISHQHVMEAVAAHLALPASDLRIVSCHLGNGASVCAIDRGLSVDTSMGMTPLEGLVMGSRCGDLDPGAYPYLMRTLGLSAEQIELALSEESGLKALSGISADLREVEAHAARGNVRAQLALQIFAYRIRKYIGGYAVAMGGLDAIAFTGGIGENAPSVRRDVCEGLGVLGAYLDQDRNDSFEAVLDSPIELQQSFSRIKVLAVRAREEWMIAKETVRLLTSAAMAAGLPPTPQNDLEKI